ncbi:DUF6705 family protein [Mangrovimonas cancribranchiae]|uniref:DUF6705 family protein n=1 Tax=Mangrovimonas cancribranchiae TaxID=3080055 RepID=A0AAU6P7G6_9FLAO
MKTIALIIPMLFFFAISCKAQIIPVEQVVDHFGNVEDETTYIKDVNNILDNYVGTWVGIQNGKSYTFIITEKIIVYDEYYSTLNDILIMKYLIVDTNTLDVIEDTTSMSDEDAPCEGIIFRSNSSGGLTYVFMYTGINEDKVSCGQNGDVFITLKNNNTQLYLKLSSYHEMYGPCLGGSAEQILPEEGILLTRQ